ncbi:UDP-N-acetylenolpyruvoylglucosamine reductase [Selenomonas ruminantium subsp. lactilytica TAM6421]|uniref:UDP-N-acetylenolpyruvoylglucosamine reductase n=1 Tax=Selenomonas ruminantium subsp. lactilytica (strain NBRC 103574 / TAM6421) TaxID=927704 RepID=I0GQ65_SELRL|nr:UDP-N-acetylmuramate dehydrogenase [Selenomonas ruminantium]BAL82902.1 UDP-N-acetylenolpyruvoylglucosamine reductase [Selenomonas ruminantium subsp. lactilytica TAM6421]
MINENFLAACREFLQPEQIMLDAPMSEHTTFKIGGPADCLLKPANLGETQKILQLVKEYELPLTFVGNGSNMLVRDKGIRGVVVNFADTINTIKVEGTKMTVGAGALLKDVAEAAAKHSLAGMEFACGIPGSMGGAVFMNAGAYGGETKSVVKGVRAVTREGEIKTYALDELELGYRHSIFQSNGEAIVEVELELTPGSEEEIRAGIADYTNRRESKQPLEMPSAGSTFKRPEGYFAGTLIDQTGLKGLSVGGAQVSTKHAGFVVNKGGATAADVVNLIHEVQKRVKEAHGVELQPEVRMIGEK